MNIDELWNKWSLPLMAFNPKAKRVMSKKQFIQAIAEIISSPVEPEVSQENGGQWICAKEKLPEKNRVVITFDNKEERDIDKYGCDFIYADPNGKLHWDWHFDDNDFYWKDFSRFSA